MGFLSRIVRKRERRKELAIVVAVTTLTAIMKDQVSTSNVALANTPLHLDIYICVPVRKFRHNIFL